MRRATRGRAWSGRRRIISIHALHEESDPDGPRMVWSDISFQSTLSMRRATREACRPGMRCRFQSTLSMRRATGSPRLDLRFGEISIHALHEESDCSRHLKDCTCHISIHALHEESDQNLWMQVAEQLHFNPRSP